MSTHVRWIVLVSVVAALAVFAAVQDRVSAEGVRRYVTLQRSAITGQTPQVTIDQVMRPAVQRSVRQGALWAIVVLAAGLSTAAVVSRRGAR